MLEDFINKVINDDCLNVLKNLPNECIDLCVTDPPYNMNYSGRGKINSFTTFENDNIDEDEHTKWFESILVELQRVLKNNTAIYIWIDFRNYPRIANVVKKYFDIKNCIIWDKMSIGMGQSYRFQHEFCIYAVKGNPPLNFEKRNVSDIWKVKRDESSEYFHPTQKPIELMEFSILYSSKPNDIVLDCFTGSGSSLIAAKRNNRQFIGVEIDENYYNICNQRIDKCQFKLF
jgi:DNA modification methylase